jgi:dCMP deaminase
MTQEKLNKFYMAVAMTAAELSYCKNHKVGAILVKDNNIISFSYNGTIKGMQNNCEDALGNTKKMLVLHAESNALTKCLVNGQSTVGATIYTTLSPCVDCAKLIIQSGIVKVYYLEQYDEASLDLLGLAGVKIEKL